MNDFPQQTIACGRVKNIMRMIAAYGEKRKAEIGAENVFDFSLGNPSIPAPDCINETIIKLATEFDSNALHRYTTAAGLVSLREKIAADLNERFGTHVGPGNIYVATGAAAALTITLNGLLLPGEEVIIPAPYFTEYKVFTEAAGGTVVPVEPGKGMEINIDGVRAALTANTKALIINTPNNPSGVIFSDKNLTDLAGVLKEHEEKTGNIVYLISDEPYRELVFDGSRIKSPIEFYDNTIMCYSWSKAMSIPGERIGYVAVSDRCTLCDDVYTSITGAARCLGYVNPPCLFQRVIEQCIGQTSDMSLYQENRNLLSEGLRNLGYEFCEPQGAFYLFLKSLEPDAKAFCERAKDYELLLVPSDDFGCTGYVRVAYCVSKDVITRSMPAFQKLIESYR